LNQQHQIANLYKAVKAVKILFTLLILSTNALAMDRWAALSMIESDNRDSAVGRVGEITRYQIRPNLWPGGSPLDARAALVVAQRIMTRRTAAFEQRHGRQPDDFEFYVLWNAPAQINHPRRNVTERAKRFANLVADSPSDNGGQIGSLSTADSGQKPVF
jgi:hypothetical protein